MNMRNVKYILLIIFMVRDLSAGKELSKSSKVQFLLPRIRKLNHSEYLTNVSLLLSSDPKFNEKVKEVHERSQDSGLLSEKVADLLHLLPEEVLAKLDKLKMAEHRKLLKLRGELKKRGLAQEKVEEYVEQVAGHLHTYSPTIPDKFTGDDLRALIRETNERLEDLDEVRKVHYKEYEIHKKLEFDELKRQLKLRHKNVKHKEEVLEKVYKHLRKMKPYHVPLSKAHLLDVWEEMDHMDKIQFNMKTFFHLHDLDGNELWDEFELKIMLQKEAENMKGEEEYDKKEMDQMVEEMRVYTMEGADLDKDRFISYPEFLDYNKRIELTDHDFWLSLGNRPKFTEDEFERYVRAHGDEVKKVISQKLDEIKGLMEDDTIRFPNA